jgi:hypothetical protein
MKLPKHAHALMASAFVFALLGPVHAADPAGKWKGEFETQAGQMKYSYQLTNTDGKITGQAVRNRDGELATNNIAEGTAKNDDVSFVELAKIQDQDIRIEYTGKIAGDELKMTRKVGDFGTTDVVLKREKEATAAVAIAGKWQSEFESQVGHLKYTYEFKLDGDKLTGSAIREVNDAKTTADIKGKLAGGEISFTEPLKIEGQDEITIEYTGKVSGDEIKFTRKVGDFATTEIVAHRLK